MRIGKDFFRLQRVKREHKSSFQEREAQPPLRRADQKSRPMAQAHQQKAQAVEDGWVAMAEASHQRT